MTRTFNYFIIPLCSVLLIALQTPEIIDKVKGIHPYAPMILVFALLTLTVSSTYWANIAAQKILDDAREKRWDVINDLAEKSLAAFSQIQLANNEPLKLSLNIMVPKRKLFASLEPDTKDPKKRKWSLFPKVLEIVYRAGEGSAHSNLKFTTNQGICGEAYRDEHFIAYDLSVNTNIDFKMNEDQKHVTKRCVVIASFPILWKNNTPDRQDYKILGVLNVESEQDGSGILLSDKSHLTKFYTQFSFVAALYSQNYL